MMKCMGKIFWLGLCALLALGCAEESEPAEGTSAQTDESGEDESGEDESGEDESGEEESGEEESGETSGEETEPNPGLGEPCERGQDCWVPYQLVCAGVCVEPECEQNEDCPVGGGPEGPYCAYGKCFYEHTIYCSPCGDFDAVEGYFEGYSCSECWDNLGNEEEGDEVGQEGDEFSDQNEETAEEEDDAGEGDGTDEKPVPWSIEACGILWPDDPYEAAVYAFVAEYFLALGPMVGCYEEFYPNPEFPDVALGLEDEWGQASSPGALPFAQNWLDQNAENFGQETFDIAERFGLEGGRDQWGRGEGGPPACEPDVAEDLPEETSVSGFVVTDNPKQDEGGMACMTKYVEVFGLSVVAEGGLTNDQVLHAAQVLAELLDNDEDGTPDDPALLIQLQSVGGMVPMFNYDGSPGSNDMMSNYFGEGVSAVLYADEVEPTKTGKFGFDATVEEILHTINHRGHAAIYPEAFAIEPDSSLLTAAMDAARGGQFMSVPASYPEEAWYHYDDTTCDYGCMAIEYIYWAIVTNMGILDDPATCQEIFDEWETCSKESLMETDVLVYDLITDPVYMLPQMAPDGVYSP